MPKKAVKKKEEVKPEVTVIEDNETLVKRLRQTRARRNIRKGRDFQRKVLHKFREYCDLSPDDARVAIGAENGEDIKFTAAAAEKMRLSIECKRTKQISILAALAQANKNTKDGCYEAVVFQPITDVGSNRKMYIVVPLQHYLEIRKELFKYTNNIPANKAHYYRELSERTREKRSRKVLADISESVD